MALDIAANKRALHSASKNITDAIKCISKSGASALWEVPRYATATTKESEPIIPSPSIFKPLLDHINKGKHSPAAVHRLPSVAECAVHLEFLEVLFVLRQSILRSEVLDEVFDIKPEYKYVDRGGEQKRLKDTTLWERRQVKWERFVALAVARFMTWWEKVREIVGVRDDGTGRELCEVTDDVLPPLDVLMVWHSFLLNPRYFMQSCDYGKKLLYHVDFPWASIHRAINSDDWAFSLTESASTTFRTITRLQPCVSEYLTEWKSYPADSRKSVIEAARFSLKLSELVSLTATGILPRDISFLQCFVDAGETTAHALRDAVLRQVSFIDKMDHHLWIRSPVLDGTLQRARSRYGNFLRLFKLYPTTMFVPTLDIDLVWHTHQCSAYRYFKATKELAGKFVNHDDSIVEDKLTVGLTRTRDLYRVRFGQEYLMCGCWDCEALLSAVDSSEARPGEELDWEDVAKEVGGDVAYYWAVEVARRKKEPIPIR